MTRDAGHGQARLGNWFHAGFACGLPADFGAGAREAFAVKGLHTHYRANHAAVDICVMFAGESTVMKRQRDEMENPSSSA